jgi:DHA2 family multidrug resistance protein
MIAMIIAGRLMSKVDTRLILLAGMLSTGTGFLMMSGLSLASHQNEIIFSGIMLAIGSGMIFVPLSTIVLSTLDPALRNEGAALFALVRNIGTSVGISFLQIMTIRNAATVQSRLTEGVRPDSPPFVLKLPEFDFASPETVGGMQTELVRQSMMVGYIDAFWFLFLLSLALLPIIWLLRPPKAARRSNPAEDT